MIDQSIEILRRRVDETGTIEPTIVRQGDDRILLQVPGIKDTTELKRKINQTAKLTFHLVNEDIAAAGQNLPATLPPNTFLVPTREGMQQLRAANPKAWEEIQAANPAHDARADLPALPATLPAGASSASSWAARISTTPRRPSRASRTAAGRSSASPSMPPAAAPSAPPPAPTSASGWPSSSTTRSSAHRSCRARSAAAAASSPASSPPSRPRSRRCCCARARCRPRSPSSRSARWAPTSAPTPSIRARRGRRRHGAGHPLHAVRLRPGVRRLRQPRHAGQHAAGVRRHVGPRRLADPARHRRPGAHRRHVGRFQRADLRARARGEGQPGARRSARSPPATSAR